LTKKKINNEEDKDWDNQIVKRGRTLYFFTAIESKRRFLSGFN
jgi:hypothetical protein